MPKQQCFQCNSDRLPLGKLVGSGVGAGGMRFQPDNMKFLALKTSVKLRATACLDCGAVALTADPSEIATLRGDKDVHCRRCNYNLTGNESGTCPECGEKDWRYSDE